MIHFSHPSSASYGDCGRQQHSSFHAIVSPKLITKQNLTNKAFANPQPLSLSFYGDSNTDVKSTEKN